MRASICVLGPLLAKRGRAAVSLPGGCNIGDRPIDLHLRGLAALGADLSLDRGYVVGTAKRLRGAEIDLQGPRGSSVTATANLLMAATLANGRTVLRHAAQEPEIEDLCRFLISAGARVDGIGSDMLEVIGVETLHSTAHTVISDRIEAATWMMAAAITAGDVTLDGVIVEHLEEVHARLDAANVNVAHIASDTNAYGRTVRVRSSGKLHSRDVVSRPYPGFPTDLQAQWTALMTQAVGQCRVRDEVFPDRFLHLPELRRFGADVARDSSSALVTGFRALHGTAVTACDLRASAALVLAALAAEGESVIRQIHHLDRGYERLDEKLASLGASVVRVHEESEIQIWPQLPAA
jgi:UDP-N-acetylglucosamine 1-carboxyvinyltransferase